MTKQPRRSRKGRKIANSGDAVRLSKIELIGVAAEPALQGQIAKICTRLMMTSDDPTFHTIVENLAAAIEHSAAVDEKIVDLKKASIALPAGDIDRAVVGCVERTLTRWAAELGPPLEEPIHLDRCAVPEQRRILLENDVRVQLGSSEVIVGIGDEPEDRIEIPARLARRGNELKLVLRSDQTEVADPNPVLLKVISHAAVAQQVALTGEPDPLVSDYSKRHLWQLLRVSWLAPDIIAAIMEGRQPATLTGRRLLRAAEVPLSWTDQRRYFGFS